MRSEEQGFGKQMKCQVEKHFLCKNKVICWYLFSSSVSLVDFFNYSRTLNAGVPQASTFGSFIQLHTFSSLLFPFLCVGDFQTYTSNAGLSSEIKICISNCITLPLRWRIYISNLTCPKPDSYSFSSKKLHSVFPISTDVNSFRHLFKPNTLKSTSLFCLLTQKKI